MLWSADFLADDWAPHFAVTIYDSDQAAGTRGKRYLVAARHPGAHRGGAAAILHELKVRGYHMFMLYQTTPNGRTPTEPSSG